MRELSFPTQQSKKLYGKAHFLYGNSKSNAGIDVSRVGNHFPVLLFKKRRYSGQSSVEIYFSCTAFEKAAKEIPFPALHSRNLSGNLVSCFAIERVIREITFPALLFRMSRENLKSGTGFRFAVLLFQFPHDFFDFRAAIHNSHLAPPE